ncbi:hypothetical protein H0I23_09060 [Cellulophaga sp. HaHaR_3_176]|uniref:hypothetical protein n=1 Tax=Cellulophaga sp. HaHaR_3_176 TaxID=1942464 RepID=UPI001C1F3F86|nr:hypothetical protein [Cellulophaga sp. HaHaR_3_176]QWX82619.1 hypothetical protein H0I23_09060 [Cellulophaga sp. HaHaR_3_176]
MELNNIDNILEKYFEATTSVAEEKALRAYFSGEEVAPHLEKYKPLFAHFTKAKEEVFTKQVPFKKSKPKFKFMYAAAAVVLLLGMFIGNKYIEQRKLEKEQAEYAYQQTKKALNLLAENFGKGTSKVAYLREFEETKQKIYNH